MKDLIFTSESGSLNATFRVDMITNTTNNFTVHQISGLDVDDSSNTLRERQLIKEFKKLPYRLDEFKTFAENEDLKLVIQDTNGENSSTLVDYPGSEDSES